MKKIFVLILSLALIFAVLFVPTQAASYSSVDNFTLSKQNLTASGKNFSYNKIVSILVRMFNIGKEIRYMLILRELKLKPQQMFRTPDVL